ncbi:MAG: hemolysin family protein [Actinobacteria bacterium]|nr:hemolysin family protein [Actinomycetota bacterium]
MILLMTPIPPLLAAGTFEVAGQSRVMQYTGYGIAAAADGRLRLTGQDWIMLASVLVLVLLATFLALAETSLVKLSKPKAMALRDEGRRGAHHLVKVVDDIDTYLNVILLLVLICQLVAATLVGILSYRWFGPIGVVVATAFEVAVLFVVAEAMPKTWAVNDPEKVALHTAPMVLAIGSFWPLQALSHALVKLAGVALGRSRMQGREVSEGEILAIADVAMEEDVIEREERALIHSVIELGDTVVREVMVPRPDVVALQAQLDVSGALGIALEAGFSRLPVYTTNLDDIAGSVNLKDLIKAERAGRGDDLVADHLRTAHFVPETKKAAILMREMQRDKFHQAIVIDEYGTMTGVVSLEDLIEELVGEIVDEYDVDEPHVLQVGGNSLSVPAKTPVDELSEMLGIALPAGTWDTVGGLVFDLAGHIPKAGEHVQVDGCEMVVEKVKGRRIDRVLVIRKAAHGTSTTR